MIYALIGHSGSASVTEVVLFMAFVLSGIALLGLLRTLKGDGGTGE